MTIESSRHDPLGEFMIKRGIVAPSAAEESSNDWVANLWSKANTLATRPEVAIPIVASVLLASAAMALRGRSSIETLEAVPIWRATPKLGQDGSLIRTDMKTNSAMLQNDLGWLSMSHSDLSTATLTLANKEQVRFSRLSDGSLEEISKLGTRISLPGEYNALRSPNGESWLHNLRENTIHMQGVTEEGAPGHWQLKLYPDRSQAYPSYHFVNGAEATHYKPLSFKPDQRELSFSFEAPGGQISSVSFHIPDIKTVEIPKGWDVLRHHILKTGPTRPDFVH